ncbi:MAG: filamentous hemagglutinin N-terminal domain-containing protein [Selenomonadaceae bacterium]|nr:filamentous hemagglutinin N-terminal domain-containing protein [Selenomonadaceae bacterium]
MKITRKQRKRNQLKKKILNRIRAALAGVMAMYGTTTFAAVDNHALPTGGQFAAGKGTIMSANGVMTVNQTTTNAAINWETFNVGANATVNFNLNGAQTGPYNVLNYSTNGGVASEIYGRLKAGAEANVWLINPNGVIIGKGAQIDVGHMHLASYGIENPDTALASWGGGSLPASAIHTDAELMSMGNVYANSISFDGGRVVIDADKLYTFEGDKVELGAHFDSKHEVEGNLVNNVTDDKVYLGVTGNNTATFVATSVAASNAKNHTSHAVPSGNYLTINDDAKEIVVGYTAYDAEANAYVTGQKGSYENSQKWRNIYANVNGTSTRVGFAWVEDSTQLERIGESNNILNKDFALKDGIAAINTKELDGGKGFNPIGNDPTSGGTAFTGKFDGLGYDIYGLTINRPDQDDIGMFGHVGDGAVIRNVNLVSGAIVGNDKVGGVVGHAAAGSTGIKIENVRNSARVLGVNNVGGIVGKAEGSATAKVNIKNAENVALIRGNTNVGGIVGEAAYTDVTGETFNTGAVKGIVNFKLADTGYASKTAAELTEATYAVSQERPADDKLRVGDTIYLTTNRARFHIKIVKAVIGGDEYTENIPDLTTFNPGDYIEGTYYGVGLADSDTKERDAKLSVEPDGKFKLQTDTSPTGTSKKDWATRNNASYFSKELAPIPASHNVGGIAGAMNNSNVGNAGFQIYNDVEIEGCYNVGGIAGTFATGTVQNVKNNGKVEATGYTDNEYHFWTSNQNDTYESGASSDVYKTFDGKRDVLVANAGGIVGYAAGTTDTSNKPTTFIKDSVNSGDVITVTAHESNYDYHISGNVGGIVGYAATVNSSGNVIRDNSAVTGYGVLIQNVENQENIIRGAHNVGGIVGDLLNAKVLDATNNGGDVAATGARAKDGSGFSKESVRSNAGANVYMTGNIGGVVGYMEGQQSYLDNVRNRGTIHTFDSVGGTVTQINRASNIGGIVGKVSYRDKTKALAFKADGSGFDNTTMSQSAAAVSPVSVTNIEGAAIRNAANTGTVIGYTDIGGIAGQMFTGEIERSYNLGNIRSSVANASESQQANMGGILGDVTAQATGFVRMYDVYNAGVIGDSTFETYGIHVGGIAGRFLGEIEKAYNIGDIYVGASVNGGIIGYAQANKISGSLGSGDPNNFNNVTLKDVFNAGNILVYKRTGGDTQVGGLIGVTESVQSRGSSAGAGTINIENAYNIGTIRSIANNNKAGGLVGHITSGGVNITNAYSTGEIYSGKLDGSIHNGTVNAIAPGGANFTNVYFIRPEDSSKFPSPVLGSGVKAINYNTRYDVASWQNGSNKLVDSYASTATTAAPFTGNFRMYEGTDGSIGSTLPILNAFKPHISDVIKTDGTTLGIATVQYGTEINPLLTFVNLNSPGSVLDLNYASAKISGRGGLVVNNGGLNITNVNSDAYFSGTFMADGGDLTINGDTSALNLASDSKFYGKNVTITNTGDLNFNGLIYAYGGNVNLEAKNITTYGKITSASNEYKELLFDRNRNGKFDDGEDVYTIDRTDSSNLKLSIEGVANTAAKAAYYTKNYTYLNERTSAVTPNVPYDIPTKASQFDRVVDIDGTAGNINVTAEQKADLYLGINKSGKIMSDGNVNITAKDIFVDSDMTIGTSNPGSSVVTLTGDSVVFDMSNMGATTKGIDKKVLMNKVLDDFSGADKNRIVIKDAAGKSIGDKGKIIFDFYIGNVLDFEKYDSGSTPFIERLNSLNAKNGDEKAKVFLWISNAEQLKGLQDMYAVGASASGVADLITAKNNAESNKANVYANTEADLTTTYSESVIADKLKDAKTASGYKDKEDAYQTAKEAEQTAFDEYVEAKEKYDQTGDPTDKAAMDGKYAIYNTKIAETNEVYNKMLDKEPELLASIEYAEYTSLLAERNKRLLQRQAADDAVTEAERLLNEGQAAHAEKDLILKTNFALKNDIDASEIVGFESIGLVHNGTGYVYGEYTGTFDGMGHNLNSLTPDSNVAGNTGLFAAIGEKGVVTNLNINASRLVGTASRVGLVAGTNNGVIKSVNTFGNTVRDKDDTGSTPKFVGGLVGFNGEHGVIVHSTAEDVVYSDSANTQVDVGGAVGMNAGIVFQTSVKSDVSVAEGGATSLGGVAGVNAGYMKDVDAFGVTAGLYEHKGGADAGKFIGAGNVGGIAGENRTVYRNAQNQGGKSTAGNKYEISTVDDKVVFKVNGTVVGTSEADAVNGAVNVSETGGTIADAYNDSHVKGWSNTGGIVGKNFGANDTLLIGNIKNTVSGKVYYVANAGDVIAGENVGGLVGVNDGEIKGKASEFTNIQVTVDAGTPATVVINSQGDITGTSGSTAIDDAAKKFYSELLVGTEEEPSQIIYGRNSGKIVAKAGMEYEKNQKAATTGYNVGGLIGVSGKDADVSNLLNGKAASVYGKVNVGGLIGENQGVLQKSINLMQNNEISGAMNVGGIVGKNTGVIVGMKNTNKYNITTNKDYVYQGDGGHADGSLKVAIDGAYTKDGTQYASYFGGVVGLNGIGDKGEVGVVADALNYANVTLNDAAFFVGGIIGRNDGRVAGAGSKIYNPAHDIDTGKPTYLDYKVQGYIRNRGAVGNENGDFIGGVIGQNNSAVYMTDVTNDLTGTVFGNKYVGGIIGQNNAIVTGGRDRENVNNPLNTVADGNFYKYDVYNNGKVTGTKYVGGLIGNNNGTDYRAVNTGTIQLAYNTGVVAGTDYVGGIVGFNSGTVDQVFNSTSAYDATGAEIAVADRGVKGDDYVGGLVGQNTGTVANSYNVGAVTGTNHVGNAVGENSSTGIVSSVYATNDTIGSHLIGHNAGTIQNTVSFVSGDSTANRLALTEKEQYDAATYVGFDASKWHFQNGASTPLLTNFLTNTYFVGDATAVYNAKNQITFVGKPEELTKGGQKVYRAKVYVADITYLAEMESDNFTHAKYVGFVYAADETGDHTIADFFNTYNKLGNEQKNLMIGNTTTAGSDGKTHAGSYTLLTSNQINTNYIYDSTPDGIDKIDAANPNMLGFKFFEVKNAPTGTTPPTPDSLDGPVVPAGKDPDTLPPLVTPKTDPYNPGVGVPTTPAPQLKITPAPLDVSLSDVYRDYGNATIKSGSYSGNITGGILGTDDVTLLGLTNINDSQAFPNSGSRITNNVGAYDWTAAAVLGGANAGDYRARDSVTGDSVLKGKSHVDPVNLTVQIGNTETVYGTAFDPATYGFSLSGLVNGDSASSVSAEINGLSGGYKNEAAAGGAHTLAGKITAPKGYYTGALKFNNTIPNLSNYNLTVLDGNAAVHRALVYVQIPIEPGQEPITNPDINGKVNVIPNDDPVIFGPDKYKPDAPNPKKPMLGPDSNYYGAGDSYQGDPNIEYIFVNEHDADLPLKVEDMYPWMEHDHYSAGHQEHWRERKAEVKFVIGGADFFNNVVIAQPNYELVSRTPAAEAEDDAALNE